MWIKLILALLQIVSAVLKSRSDSEQQRIGGDKVVQKALAEILIRTRLAKQVDAESLDWSDADIDKWLSKYYRSDGPDQ